MPNHDSSCILNSQSLFVFFFPFFWLFCWGGWCGKLPFEPELISTKKGGTKMCTVMLNRSTNLLSMLQTDLSILLILYLLNTKEKDSYYLSVR